MDFNNETTVGTPAAHIESVTVLEMRYNTLLAMKDYLKKKGSGIAADISNVRSDLKTLYALLEPAIRRHIKPRKVTQLKNLLDSKDYEDLAEAFSRINHFLDAHIRLTRLDKHQ